MAAPTPANGERIVFVRGENILTCSYPDVRRTVKCGQGQDPHISPDGVFVVYEESGGGSERHFAVADTRTGKVLRRRSGTLPHFSPDGKRIAFSLFLGGQWLAHVIDADFTNARRLSYSANGPALVCGWAGENVCAYSESFDGKLFAVRPDGKVARDIPLKQIFGDRDFAIPFGCSWSDDLARIVVSAQTDEESKFADSAGDHINGLYLYDAGSGKRRLLTAKGISASSPRWYGRNLLAYGASPNTRKAVPAQVYLMDVTTGETRVLLENADYAALSRRGGGG